MTAFMIPIKVKKLSPLATFERAHENDSGYDLTCTGVTLTPYGATLHLGIEVEPPPGTRFNLYMRSSFPDTGWAMNNSVGIIDAGYRGEWMMKVHPWRGRRDMAEDIIGRKVAQAVLYNTMTPNVEIVDELDKTIRGDGGFGSTDK